MTASILDTAAARLTYLGDVQNMLASNLANIDTPGYQPQSAVSFSDYLNSQQGGTQMLQDDANDFSGGAAAPMARSVADTSQTHSQDGNAVSLDKELVQMSQNETDQQLTTNLYQAYMGMFKTALGSSGS